MGSHGHVACRCHGEEESYPFSPQGPRGRASTCCQQHFICCPRGRCCCVSCAPTRAPDTVRLQLSVRPARAFIVAALLWLFNSKGAKICHGIAPQGPIERSVQKSLKNILPPRDNRQ
eukprot:10707281-Heterocapsa_arctica.AAC.1